MWWSCLLSVFNMEEEKEYSLDEKKGVVQKILDSHLWDQSFSVENFDEDMLSLLISLLTEKDDEKKKELREQVNDKIKTSERGLFSAYLWIHEVWDSMDTVRYSKSELNDLSYHIKNDKELDSISDQIELL